MNHLNALIVLIVLKTVVQFVNQITNWTVEIIAFLKVYRKLNANKMNGDGKMEYVVTIALGSINPLKR